MSTRQTPSPFCKVCKDAGCSERDYTSHFVKDRPGPNGKVVCPTLLNQACLTCGNKGHTSSYCPKNANTTTNTQAQTPTPTKSSTSKYVPYAHPHGPRIRLQLDAPALSSASSSRLPVFNTDVLKVDLKHAAVWGDEPVVSMNEQFRKIAEDTFMKSLTSDAEFDFIAKCDRNNNQ